MRKIMASLDIGYNSIKFIVTETSRNNVYVLSSSITPMIVIVWRQGLI